MSENSQPNLSAREHQLIALAATGFTDIAIANHLGISETTVKTYWRRVRAKVGAFSRTELVAKVLRVEMENDRQKVETKDSAVGRFYKRLLDEAPDAILIVATDGMIKLVNDAAAEMFGWPRAELRGRHLSDLLPESHRRTHERNVNEFVASPTKGPMRPHIATPALHRSGAEFAIDASLSLVTEGDETYVICIVRSMHSRLYGSDHHSGS